jgi:hypothetical protein
VLFSCSLECAPTACFVSFGVFTESMMGPLLFVWLIYLQV